jgi:Tfp pilus assembly protein PilX
MGGGGANPNFGNAACTQRFPRDMDEYMELVTGGKIAKSRCADPAAAEKFVGVCIPMGSADASFSGQTLGDAASQNAQQWDNGAGYGNDFIKVLDGAQSVPYGGGASSGDDCCALAAQGRYWVEVFPYNATSVAIAGMGRAPVPGNAYPFVFRITALARGIKGGTVSVLRTYYTPFPMRAAP